MRSQGRKSCWEVGRAGSKDVDVTVRKKKRSTSIFHIKYLYFIHSDELQFLLGEVWQRPYNASLASNTILYDEYDRVQDSILRHGSNYHEDYSKPIIQRPVRTGTVQARNRGTKRLIIKWESWLCFSLSVCPV